MHGIGRLDNGTVKSNCISGRLLGRRNAIAHPSVLHVPAEKHGGRHTLPPLGLLCATHHQTNALPRLSETKTGATPNTSDIPHSCCTACSINSVANGPKPQPQSSRPDQAGFRWYRRHPVMSGLSDQNGC